MVLSLLFSLHDFVRDYFKKKFFICQLPRLALNEVLRSMSQIELVRLALTSSKMESIIKTARMKSLHQGLVLNGQCFAITFGTGGTTKLFCGEKEQLFKEKISKYQLKKWSNKDCGIENLTEIRNRLKNILPCQKESLNLEWSRFDSTDLESNRLLLDALQELSYVLIWSGRIRSLDMSGRISSKDLGFIMEKANPKINFHLRNIRVPEDFKSSHAFKFRSLQYDDAKWVKVSDLFVIRNSHTVVLNNSQLSTSDFNSLIEYWLKCPTRMWRVLKSSLIEMPNVKELFKGLLVLTAHYSVGTLHFLLSKSPKKFWKLLVVSYDNGISLCALSADEESSYKHDMPCKTFRPEYNVINALTKKATLESKKKLMEGEKKELGELNELLEDRQVRYIDGMPTIDM